MKISIFFFLAFCLSGFVYSIDPVDSNRYNPQFWNLPTGSQIAYYHFKGNEVHSTVPIIFLHGGPGGFVTTADKEAFSKLADFGFDVYLYDQIGSGKSARLRNIRDYSVKRHLKDLEEIVKLIGSEKVNIIAHSWGASLAGEFLAIHPEKVEKLVFSGPGGILPKNFKALGVHLPDTIRMKNRDTIRHKATEYLDPVSYKRFMRISNYSDIGIRIATDEEIDSLLDLFIANMSAQKAKQSGFSNSTVNEKGSGGYSHFRTGIYINKGKDRRKILQYLDTPVLILLGESDPILWGCIADYLKVFKNVKLTIVPDSGHSVFYYQPEFCLEKTREFLK